MSYGKFALVYDRLMADMPYEHWLQFAKECLKHHGVEGHEDCTPLYIVDLGCGTGNITIPLAEAGYRMYGIDLSEDMLAVARDKYHQRSRSRGLLRGRVQQQEPVWLQQDMTEWGLDRAVDAVISFCDCLNYLTEEEEVAAVFRETWAGLKPGGLFMFDVHTPLTLQQYGDNQPFVYNEDDLSYIWLCDYDDQTRIIEHELTFFVRDDRINDSGTGEASGKYLRFDEIHTQRAYPLTQLRGMLEQAGFVNIQLTADFSRKPPDGETARAFFAANKPVNNPA